MATEFKKAEGQYFVRTLDPDGPSTQQPSAGHAIDKLELTRRKLLDLDQRAKSTTRQVYFTLTTSPHQTTISYNLLMYILLVRGLCSATRP